MDCFGFCGEKCSKKKKKAKEKYKEEVEKETNGVTVPVKKETKVPESAGDGQKMGTKSKTFWNVSQETGDLSPHIAPSGVGDPASIDDIVIDPASLDDNVIDPASLGDNVKLASDKMPNESSTGHNDVKQTSQVTHEIKFMQKEKAQNPKHRPYHDNQESSDSETDSSSDSATEESTSTDDSNDSPAERTKSSKTKKKSRTIIINSRGGIVDLGKHNTNKIVHIQYGGHQKKRKNKEKDRSSRGHKKDMKAHMDQEQSQPDCPGNFHKICDETDTIYNMELIVEVAKSVGIIRSPTVQGTGFRVGDSYIMTALHVVEGIINSVLQPVSRKENELKFKLLEDRKVYIDFDFKLLDDASQQGQTVQKSALRFNFEPEIIYKNERLDTAVLKLKRGTSDFPCQLTRFCHCVKNLPMYFVGHSRYQVKKFDRSNPRDVTQSTIQKYQSWSKNHQVGCGENYRGYDGAEDPKKILFDCSRNFNKGASGSPGFIISAHDKMPYAVSMLLCGYPDWYHDEAKEKMDIPHGYTFEQGVCLTEVYQDMKKPQYSGLCSEIFGC